VRYERRLEDIEVAANSAQQLAVLPEVAGLSRTYFVELGLASASGMPISHNVYWLSTQADELDWKHSDWSVTPTTRYADLTPLQSLPVATCEVRATARHERAEDVATVTLTVPPSSGAVALFQHVSVRRSAGGELMLPILWSDNDVTLWPGESLTITAHFAASGAGTPVIEVTGWNVPTRTVPLAVAGRTAGAPRGTDTLAGALLYNPPQR